MTGSKSGARAFTLIELLVVIAVIAILAALLIPALAAAKKRGYLINCTSNLKQDGTAIQMFTDDYEGVLPNGPSGIINNKGLSVGQVAAYYSGMPNFQDYLLDYIYPYVGAPEPSSAIIIKPPINYIKILFCPANEQYNPKAVNSNTLVGFISYQMVEGGTDPGRGYCRLKWNPFGYNFGTVQPPHKLSEVVLVKSPAEMWAMVDCDKFANPGIGAAATLPDMPIHGKVRNYLWFDGHVAPEKVRYDVNSVGPYAHPFFDINVN